jgi:hypothetical protein
LREVSEEKAVAEHLGGENSAARDDRFDRLGIVKQVDGQVPRGGLSWTATNAGKPAVLDGTRQAQ